MEIWHQGADAYFRTDFRAGGIAGRCEILPPQPKRTAAYDYRIFLLVRIAFLSCIRHEVFRNYIQLLKKEYKHLFFDLDGTLWDFDSNARNALLILFESYSARMEPAVDFELFLSRYQYHNEQAWALYRKGQMEKNTLRTVRFVKAFADAGLTGVSWIKSFADDFLDVCPRQAGLVEGTRESLEILSSKYQMHIITNGFREIQSIKLASGGIDQYFRQIINSEDCGVRKPGAAIFEYAMKVTGALKIDSVMIGDDWEADIIGARDFGIDQVFLVSGEEKVEDHNKLWHNYKPTYVVSNMHQLLDFL